jgi:2-dehydro-3-deoxyphosphogluconate aldolase/(4S)-4-hydroxy-2-oxoglutarate aldolase
MDDDAVGTVPFLVASFPQLGDVPAIGILRGCPLDRAVEVARAAVDAGMGVLEVTFDSDRAGEQIERLRAQLPGVAVGAGTVLDLDALGEAVDRGADFVVTPIVDEELIEACIDHELPCLPGAASPTEVWRAYRAGAAAVKVFPAEHLGGPAYLRALRAPLAEVDLVPTGGLDAGNVREYLDAGAVAVGVGSTVFERDAMRSGDVGAIWGRAAKVVGAVKATP